MTRITNVAILTICLTSYCFAQTDLVATIDSQARQIDSNKSLTIKTFDANEVYETVFDGGGEINVYLKSGQPVKVEQNIGLSYGRLTTIIYLKDGLPTKVIEREENFKTKDDQSGLDYTKLNQVFEATVYFTNWDKDESKVLKKGKRKFSEGECSNLAYEPLVRRAKNLINK
jgi:hypothetical protein